jgi:hypothetical protein
MAQTPRLSAELLSVPKGSAGLPSQAEDPPEVDPQVQELPPVGSQAGTHEKGRTETHAAQPPTGRVALTLRITPELHERLRRMAFEQRRPMQDLILEAVGRWLDG